MSKIYNFVLLLIFVLFSCKDKTHQDKTVYIKFINETVNGGYPIELQEKYALSLHMESKVKNERSWVCDIEWDTLNHEKVYPIKMNKDSMYTLSYSTEVSSKDDKYKYDPSQVESILLKKDGDTIFVKFIEYINTNYSWPYLVDGYKDDFSDYETKRHPYDLHYIKE